MIHIVRFVLTICERAPGCLQNLAHILQSLKHSIYFLNLNTVCAQYMYMFRIMNESTTSHHNFIPLRFAIRVSLC